MKWVSAMLLALALAGCADSGSFDREKPVEQLVAPTEQILPADEAGAAQVPSGEGRSIEARRNKGIIIDGMRE